MYYLCISQYNMFEFSIFFLPLYKYIKINKNYEGAYFLDIINI